MIAAHAWDVTKTYSRLWSTAGHAGKAAYASGWGNPSRHQPTQTCYVQGKFPDARPVERVRCGVRRGIRLSHSLWSADSVLWSFWTVQAEGLVEALQCDALQHPCVNSSVSSQLEGYPVF